MKKSRVTLLNMIMALTVQICTVISGFVVPRIILSYFGSSTNGLVSSLLQLLNYIALIEGGITSVVTANLYKPIVNGDYDSVSSVLVTAKQFYKKIAIVFIGYSLLVSIVFPLLKKTEFSFVFIFSLSIIISVGIFIQYMFSLTLKTLLDADKKSFVVSSTQSIIIVANIILAIISVRIFPSIHILKAFSAILFVLQPIVYGGYVKKHYPIDWTAKPNNSLIKERWNGFAINTAAFVHNSTDVVILTIFTDLQTVSIYSVYALVTNGLKQLIGSLLTGLTPVIGQSYAKRDFDDLHQKMDVYEYIVLVLVCFTFSLAGLLITPFVLLYTNGVSDTNYNQVVFGILLSVSEAVYLLKMPHLTLSYTANKFKEISKHAYIEAGINIIVSLILVNFMGLIGVAIGTIAGMLYRMIFHVYYTGRIIPNRFQSIFYKKLCKFISVTIIGIIICRAVYVPDINIIDWVISAIIYALIFAVLIGLLSLACFKKELIYIYT